MKSLLWYSILAIVSGKLPHNQRLVPGGRQDHIRILGVSSDLGNPIIMTPEGSPQLQCFAHFLYSYFFSCRSESSNISLVVLAPLRQKQQR